MKKLILLALTFAAAIFGQAVRFDTPVYTTNGSCVSGKQCPVLAIPGATVAVCTPPNCAARATTYTNSGAGTACATNAQLTPATGGACTPYSDAQGNAGFWILPGNYNYYITLPNGGATYGPYPISVGSSEGCPSGATCDVNYNTLAAACTAAGSGTLYVTKNWTGTPTQTIGCNMQFLGNGKITWAANATLTWSTGATITAPTVQQIFDMTASGAAIVLPSQQDVFVRWFGTNAAAINAAMGSGTKQVTSPCGTYTLLTTQVTVPRGVNVTTPTCAEWTSTTTGTAVLLSDPYRQTISLRVRRTTADWPSTDSSSLGINILGVTGAQENTFDFTVTGFNTCRLNTNSGGDITDNVYLHEEYQDCKVSANNRPAGGAGVNQENHLKFLARINGGSTTCPTFAISAATNASPIQITATGIGTAVAALTNKSITVDSATGNTGANGIWSAVFVDANNVTLTEASGTGAYTGNGVATVPIAGTKYIYMESGSDNEQTFINPELQGKCTEYAADIRSNGAVFMTSPRLENTVRNAMTFAANSYGSQVIAASTNSGVVAPTIVPARNNVCTPLQCVWDSNAIAGSPWTMNINGVTGFQIKTNGAMYTAATAEAAQQVYGSLLAAKNGTPPTLADTGFGTGASISATSTSTLFFVTTGSVGTPSDHAVVNFTNTFPRAAGCSALNLNSGLALISPITTSTQTTIYGPVGGGNFPAGVTIQVMCNGN